MASTHIRSVGVAAEVSFGSLDANNEPDASGLSFAGLECMRATLAPFGDSLQNERIEARDGPHVLPPEPDTTHDTGGSRIRRRQGTIQLTCPLRTGPTAGGAYSTMALGQLLDSGFSSYAPLIADSEVPAGGIDSVSFTPTAAGNYRAGDVIKVTHGGIAEYVAVTDVDAVTPIIYHSPECSTAIDGTDTVRLMQQYCVENDFAGVGSSVALKLDGHEWQTYAVGCRWQSIAIQLTGRRVELVITMFAQHIYDSHTMGTVSEPTRMDGSVSHMLGSRVTLSSTTSAGVASPAGLARLGLNVDEFSAELTNTLAPVSTSNSVLGASDLEVADFSAAVNLTLSAPESSIADDFRDMVERSLMVGFGPQGAEAGAALYLPSAVLQNDPSAYDLSGDVVRMPLTYGAGRWTGDVGTTAPAATVCRFALGR